MSRVVLSRQGDTVDAICYRHYGYTHGVTEQVLAHNPGLAARGHTLPMGVSVTLPDVSTKPEQKNINLWD
jgi:phage tail protein X